MEYNSIYLIVHFHDWYQFSCLVKLQWFIFIGKSVDTNLHKTISEKVPETYESVCIGCFHCLNVLESEIINDNKWSVFSTKFVFYINCLLINESLMVSINCLETEWFTWDTDCHLFSIYMHTEVWLVSSSSFFLNKIGLFQCILFLISFFSYRNEYHKPTDFLKKYLKIIWTINMNLNGTINM